MSATAHGHDGARSFPFDPHPDRIGRGHALASSVDSVWYCRTIGAYLSRGISRDYGCSDGLDTVRVDFDGVVADWSDDGDERDDVGESVFAADDLVDRESSRGRGFVIYADGPEMTDRLGDGDREVAYASDGSG